VGRREGFQTYTSLFHLEQRKQTITECNHANWALNEEIVKHEDDSEQIKYEKELRSEQTINE